MQRLMIEVLLPSEEADTAQARVHELVTREGWVLESVHQEAVDWVGGLALLREALGEPLVQERLPIGTYLEYEGATHRVLRIEGDAVVLVSMENGQKVVEDKAVICALLSR